jgi:hypothetical protein
VIVVADVLAGGQQQWQSITMQSWDERHRMRRGSQLMQFLFLVLLDKIGATQ